jgi:hypothetical protein
MCTKRARKFYKPSASIYMAKSACGSSGTLHETRFHGYADKLRDLNLRVVQRRQPLSTVVLSSTPHGGLNNRRGDAFSSIAPRHHATLQRPKAFCIAMASTNSNLTRDDLLVQYLQVHQRVLDLKNQLSASLKEVRSFCRLR